MTTLSDIISRNIVNTNQTYGDILEGNTDIDSTLNPTDRETYHAIKRADKLRLLNENNRNQDIINYVPGNSLTTVAGIHGEVMQMC